MGTDTEVLSHGGRSRLVRLGLAALMGIVALNVWTGSPLLGLWIGSRVQGTGPPSMAAVFAVFVTIAVASFVLVKVLGRLDGAYERAAGGSQTVRRHVPWLRSMRGERPQYPGSKPRLTALERILVGMVIVVVSLFEIWFFFFSTSPIDSRSGRGALDPEVVAAEARQGRSVSVANRPPPLWR